MRGRRKIATVASGRTWRAVACGRLIAARLVLSDSNLKFVTSILQFRAATMRDMPRLDEGIEKVQVGHAGPRFTAKTQKL